LGPHWVKNKWKNKELNEVPNKLSWKFGFPNNGKKEVPSLMGINKSKCKWNGKILNLKFGKLKEWFGIFNP